MMSMDKKVFIAVGIISAALITFDLVRKFRKEEIPDYSDFQILGYSVDENDYGKHHSYQFLIGESGEFPTESQFISIRNQIERKHHVLHNSVKVNFYLPNDKDNGCEPLAVGSIHHGHKDFDERPRFMYINRDSTGLRSYDKQVPYPKNPCSLKKRLKNISPRLARELGAQLPNS